MQGVADPALEDRSESDEVLAKLRKCSGKRSEEWKIMEDIGGTQEKAQDSGREALADILQKQSETFGQFRCTAQCGFKIKYQFKNNRLKVYTLGEHSHENEIRKRGLKSEKASKLVEAVEVVPTSKQWAQCV
jgi:hypothetical protein